MSGDHWIADFDRGGRRSEDFSLGCEAGGRFGQGPWDAQLRVRGRAGAELPARGRLLQATIGYAAERCSLGLGRGHPPWVFCEDAGLLLSHHPGAFDHVYARIDRLTAPGLPGAWGADGFLGYLDDADREIPYPLLWGMRAHWRPLQGLHLEVQRTIMFGGAGRTEKLQPGDIWDIFLGRGEGGRGPDFALSDSDQKLGYLLRLWPQAWVRRHLGISDLELFWLYAGEDQLVRGFPTAPGRAHGMRLHLTPSFACTFAFLSTRDDRNQWYYHKVFRTGYAYHGYLLGHPMGGDARAWKAAIWAIPRAGSLLMLRISREERGYYWGASRSAPVPEGGFWQIEGAMAVDLGRIRLTTLLSAADAWGGDPGAGRLARGNAEFIIDVVGSDRRQHLSRETVWGARP